MATEVEVIFQPDGKRARLKSGGTVLEAAKLVGADIASVCGGKGTCGKCRVIIKGEVKDSKPITEVEKKIFSPTEISAGYRLACCTKVEGHLTVRIPEESRTGRQRLQIEGIETLVKLEPIIKKYFIKLPVPTLKDARSDTERLLDELKTQCGLEQLKVNYNLLQSLPITLRDSEWKITVVIWNNDEIIQVEAKDTTQRIFGYALDLGTTKLAGYLLDLNTGRVAAVDSLMNPQIPYGEDVISRITYATRGFKNQKELQQVVVTGINQILKNLLEKQM